MSTFTFVTLSILMLILLNKILNTGLLFVTEYFYTVVLLLLNLKYINKKAE